MKQVTVIQHVSSEGLGHLEGALTAASVKVRWVRPNDPVVESTDALIVLGGPMGVHDTAAHPRLRDELRAIEHALACGRPVLGICLGSQLLAQVLGARVSKATEAELGWKPVTVSAPQDPVLGLAPQTFSPLHWHHDVFTLPTGATALARSALTELQAFSYREQAWGLLFHLEATEAQVRAMCVESASEVPDVPALLAETKQNAAAAVPIAQRVLAAWVARI